MLEIVSIMTFVVRVVIPLVLIVALFWSLVALIHVTVGIEIRDILKALGYVAGLALSILALLIYKDINALFYGQSSSS